MSPLGHDGRLYILAFDHRRSFEKAMFGISGSPTAAERARIIDAKHLIFEGLQLAVDGGASKSTAGVLVDEDYGADVARAAADAGLVLTMPVERSGQRSFAFEYGDDFAAHVEEFEPTLAKALVRWNPEGDAVMNGEQGERLARLSTWLHDSNRKLLFELLVPAEPHQIAAVGGSVERYDAELRPELMAEAIGQIQSAGVEADVWKIEGVDSSADCAAIAAQARAGGRESVGCVVLGRGADAARVDDWLRAGAGVPGYMGFAVGRSIWWDAIEAYLGGALPRPDAARGIADNYLRLIEVYEAAAV
jgi:myo-inositol catabolism protein IolC